MINSWRDAQCVVTCGGKGSRLWPLTLEKQKSMLPIGARPVIGRVIDYWRKFSDDFIFIIGHGAGEVIVFAKAQPIKSEFIPGEEDRRGLAEAVLLAEPFIKDKFILVLGDCLVKGEFKIPDNFEQGVGVYRTDDQEAIKRSYSVESEGEWVKRVIEKPTEPPNDLCGMGIYFFDRRIFEAIKKTSRSARTGRLELTDAIQTMIDDGHKVSPAILDGFYININYPDDLERAARNFI